MSGTPGMELVVVNRWTGEQVDLAAAGDEEIAAFHAAAEDARAELDDVIAGANRELLRRLDRRLSWSGTVGRFKLEAPSPTAGTTDYPEVELEAELRGLVTRGVIDADGAAAALKRELVVTFAVPIGYDLSDLRDRAMAQLAVRIGDAELRVTEAKVARKSVQAGITALSKVPGAAAAIARVKRKLPTPPRRVKVKPVRDA